MNLHLNILNPTGLHARPAAMFAATAKKFKASIRARNLTTGGDWAEAKSIIGVLKLGVECGHQIELTIEGEDEQQAAQALRQAVESGLGEGLSTAPPSVEKPVAPPVSEKPAAPKPPAVKPTDERLLAGISGAPGIAIGQALLWQEERISVPRRMGCDYAVESARLSAAREAARLELAGLQAKIETEAGAEESKIFEAHQMFLDDSTLLDTAEGAMKHGLNAEAAWMDSVNESAETLSGLSDATLAARAVDLRDVGGRVLKHVLGTATGPGLSLSAPSVIIARDLTPSQTAGLDKSLVLAFCTAEGGATAHTAILARALQIPAVVGLGDDVLQIADGETLIVDGARGQVRRHPTEAEQQAAQSERARQAEQSQVMFSAAAQPAITLDGQRVEVVANIGGLEDSRQALEFGAEGVGLLRTEFLYLQRNTAPDEEDQFAAYQAIFDVMGARPVVVRTLDIGGDKMLPYLDLGREENPFLGWRAIRISLDRPDLFQPQLRALLRAAVGHDIRIMFPMIATLEEIRAAKSAVEDARVALAREGNAYAERVQLGMMVEIPSAAVMADIFAREVDFFSIGTNDLTQYSMAAERTNKRVARLGDGIHPSILRLIQQVVEAAHGAGRWVGVCGELGGDVEAVPVLLGLGVDELSMTPAAIPQAKAIIRQWKVADAKNLAAEVLKLDTAQAVRETVRERMENRTISSPDN